MADELEFAARLARFGSERYKELREPQARALEGYTQHIDEKDIAIELPTGVGKTLIALLIADYALDNGRSVAYLTGNNQLADQVIEQAGGLGLDVVKFSGGNYPPAHIAAYNDAQVVAVMNYWTYFNSHPRVEPADVVIFDDAHLAEQPLAGLFGLRVDRREQPALHDRICELVLDQTGDFYPAVELMRESMSAGRGAPVTPPELLAFTHWDELAGSVADLLSDQLPDEVRRFTWPQVRQHLGACAMLIGPAAIEVRPYHPPSQTLRGYASATQRVYLSATLGTMDDLQRRLGVDPVVNVLEGPVAADEVGQRLFLLYPGDKQPLDDEPVAFALAQAEQAGRTAWLCASHAEADAVEMLLDDHGIVTYRLRRGDDDALDRWSDDARGHLVTAGRYDGLDLAGDLCRLVVIPSVPAASTEFERFVMAYLGDATYMRHRVGQRVTQALGRANRQRGDWAMYVGLSPEFGTLLAQSAVQQAIPPDVRPLVDAALRRVSDGQDACRLAADEFWSRRGAAEPASESTSQGHRSRPGRPRPTSTAASANDEVTAVTSLWLGDPRHAAEAAARAAASLSSANEVEHAAFWRYVEAQAHHEEGGAGAVGRSIDALRAAVEGGARTAWFVRLGRVLTALRGEQAGRTGEMPWTVWDDWIRQSGAAGVRRAVERCRPYVRGTHDQQADAIQTLGRMAGVTAGRPEGQSVTDVRWSWSPGRRIERRLWEVKTEGPDKVPRAWVNQALGQIAEEHPSARLHVVGCIVTHLDEVEDDAARAAADQLCILHVEAISALVDFLGARLLAYADKWGEGHAAERGQAREEVESQLPRDPWLANLLKPSGGRILRRADVTAVFS